MAHRTGKTSVKKQLGKAAAVPRQRRTGRIIWLVATGVVAGIAGGFFALRMLVPPGEPKPAGRLERQGSSPVGNTQPEEILVSEEPVEISTRMRPGEWTEESLEGHLEEYRQQIRDMGASDSQIVTSVDRTDDGAAVVVVSWDRSRA